MVHLILSLMNYLIEMQFLIIKLFWLDSPLSVRGAQRHCLSGKVACLLQSVTSEILVLIAPAQKAHEMRRILHFPQHCQLQPLKKKWCTVSQ